MNPAESHQLQVKTENHELRVSKSERALIVRIAQRFKSRLEAFSGNYADILTATPSLKNNEWAHQNVEAVHLQALSGVFSHLERGEIAESVAFFSQFGASLLRIPYDAPGMQGFNVDRLLYACGLCRMLFEKELPAICSDESISPHQAARTFGRLFDAGIASLKLLVEENSESTADTHAPSPTRDRLLNSTPESQQQARLGFRLFHEHRNELTEEWYRRYAGAVGESAHLSSVSFKRVAETWLFPAIRAAAEAGIERAIEQHANKVNGFVDESIPLRELQVIVSLICQIYWELCQRFNLTVESYRAVVDAIAYLNQVLTARFLETERAHTQPRIRALEVEAGRLPPDQRSVFHGVVGASKEMREVFRRLAAAGAAGAACVLITGESGTGKELAAKAIHEIGPKPNAPFVAVNCAALPESLVESELFGHKRGAFSGALGDFSGLVRAAANGGTLLLDEITEMTTALQAKLLRMLQERKVRPVGSSEEYDVDVRVIALTNRDPAEAVKTGALRKDLYYRLQALEINLPPLRDRRGDVPLLVRHFMEVQATKLGIEASQITIEGDALRALQKCAWHGNVRELGNAIEHAITFGSGHRIDLKSLPVTVTQACESNLPSGSEEVAWPTTISSSAGPLADAEREMIMRALRESRWNKLRAAANLGISRKALYSRMAKYRLSRTWEPD